MNIELRAITKSYGRLRALDHVSITMTPGQVVTLMGPNGAGKTTLLRALYGLVRPDQGSILFDGQEFHRERMDLRQKMFFLPDFPPLFGSETVLRNIAIILHLFGADGPGAKDKVLTLLREFELLPQALNPVQSLSRGQLYKTALIGMIAADRELWMFDEPFASGMDPLGLELFKHHVHAAAQRGRTILYTTQILDVAERFADRICVIHQGEIKAFDTFTALQARAENKEQVLVDIFRKLDTR